MQSDSNSDVCLAFDRRPHVDNWSAVIIISS